MAIHNLCKPCAAKAEKRYEVHPTDSYGTEKITCDYCGRRRFGRKYEVKRRNGSERKTNKGTGNS